MAEEKKQKKTPLVERNVERTQTLTSWTEEEIQTKQAQMQSGKRQGNLLRIHRMRLLLTKIWTETILYIKNPYVAICHTYLVWITNNRSTKVISKSMYVDDVTVYSRLIPLHFLCYCHCTAIAFFS